MACNAEAISSPCSGLRGAARPRQETAGRMPAVANPAVRKNATPRGIGPGVTHPRIYLRQTIRVEFACKATQPPYIPESGLGADVAPCPFMSEAGIARALAVAWRLMASNLHRLRTSSIPARAPNLLLVVIFIGRHNPAVSWRCPQIADQPRVPDIWENLTEPDIYRRRD